MINIETKKAEEILYKDKTILSLINILKKVTTELSCYIPDGGWLPDSVVEAKKLIERVNDEIKR